MMASQEILKIIPVKGLENPGGRVRAGFVFRELVERGSEEEVIAVDTAYELIHLRLLMRVWFSVINN